MLHKYIEVTRCTSTSNTAGVQYASIPIPNDIYDGLDANDPMRGFRVNIKSDLSDSLGCICGAVSGTGPKPPFGYGWSVGFECHPNRFVSWYAGKSIIDGEISGTSLSQYMSFLCIPKLGEYGFKKENKAVEFFTGTPVSYDTFPSPYFGIGAHIDMGTGKAYKPTDASMNKAGYKFYGVHIGNYDGYPSSEEDEFGNIEAGILWGKRGTAYEKWDFIPFEPYGTTTSVATPSSDKYGLVPSVRVAGTYDDRPCCEITPAWDSSIYSDDIALELNIKPVMNKSCYSGYGVFDFNENTQTVNLEGVAFGVENTGKLYCSTNGAKYISSKRYDNGSDTGKSTTGWLSFKTT